MLQLQPREKRRRDWRLRLRQLGLRLRDARKRLSLKKRRLEWLETSSNNRGTYG